MEKVQQKISGGFRTAPGAIEFCRIRSYLGTLQKNQIKLFDGIVWALAGQPWLPSNKPSAAPEKMASAQHQEKSPPEQSRFNLLSAHLRAGH